MIRIGYFADGPWSHKALEKISRNSDLLVCFIVARYSNPDQILKRWAKKLNIKFFVFKDINKKECLEIFAKFNADLFVSMSFNQIFKKQFLAIPQKGVINCHAGALPFYRGRSILNWVLINDEESFGVTVHFVDEGIDTGDIILQTKHQISDQDNYRTLLDRASTQCADLLYKSLNLINEDNFSKLSQTSIDTRGSYYKQRKIGDEIIRWNQSSRALFNFMRALTFPGPLAKSSLGDQIVFFSSCVIHKSMENKELKPGLIIGVDEKYILVCSADSQIKIPHKSIFTTSKKTEFKQFAIENFEVGMLLG